MSNSRPHICFVAPNAYPVLSDDKTSQIIGGAEVQQSIVAKGLAKRGYTVSMVCLDFGQPAVCDVDGIRVYRACKPGAGLPVVRFIWPRVSSLWRAMARANADIYYQRTAGMVTGLMSVFCKRHGKKSIFAASANPNLDRNTDRIRYRRDRWIYEYGLRNVDRILVQNSEQAALCMQNFQRESILVPNCYAAPASRIDAPQDDAIWVGSIRPLKRPELLLELASALPEFRFRMIGGPAPGYGAYFEAIRTRAAALANVDFTGFVPYGQVDAHFDRAALLINTSASEGFPNTFLQAWARGVVTVSLVDPGAILNGAPVGHVAASMEQMLAEVRQLMMDHARRTREGERCRSYFDRHHRPDRVLDLYEAIIAELAG